MIIELGNTLVSEEVFTQRFACDLVKCKGACCVEGDRGAPLEKEEITKIESLLPQIKTYMSSDGIELLNSEGFHEGEEIDDFATTCLPGGECVFVYKENGVLGCAIEKTYYNEQTDFVKPISCHLYPIRIGRAGELETVNYHQWDICNDACSNGKKLNLPLFRFVKNPLIRKYGEPWYNELELVYEEYQRQFPEQGI